MQMTVLVVDLKVERGQQIATLLHSTGVDTWLFNHRRLHVPDFWADTKLPQCFDLLILHRNNSDKWDKLERTTKLTVKYTGGDVIPVSRQGEYWIQRSMETDSILSREELDEILAWAKEVNEGAADTLLPHILGGSERELPLQVLHALYPIGLKWEAKGIEAVLEENSLERSTFEFAIAERVKGHLKGDETQDWPPPKYGRYIAVLNRLLKGNLASRSEKAKSKYSANFEGPDYLGSALLWMASSSGWEEWNERLSFLRDLMLDNSV